MHTQIMCLPQAHCISLAEPTVGNCFLNRTEQNGTERNGTERNGTERNRTEQNETELVLIEIKHVKQGTVV